MSYSFAKTVSELERLAAYEGRWRALREERPLLEARIEELREREARPANCLLVALIGGTGVGKSTLLNALAGDAIAEVSRQRPCTSAPTAYLPPGVDIDLGGWRCVARSALENLVLIDTPDSDSIAGEHRVRLQEVLRHCDVILLCATQEKYLDEDTWAPVRPLRGERRFVCVETKAGHTDEPFEEDWRARLEGEGFTIDRHFRIEAKAAFKQKLDGRPLDGDAYEFPALEAYLHEQQNTQSIAHIKRSNAAGLLRKTVARLHQRLSEEEAHLEALHAALQESEEEMAEGVFEIIRRRLFTESYLWAYAMNREVCLRMKGFTGAVYRFIEAIRAMPARLAGWLPGRRSAAAPTPRAQGRRAYFDDDIEAAAEEAAQLYRSQRSRVANACVRAGFDPPDEEAGAEAFKTGVAGRVSDVLRVAARDRIAACARLLTSWPVILLLDAPPIAFLVYASFTIVRSYLTAPALDTSYITDALVVLIIIEVWLLIGVALGVRALAWGARRLTLRQMRAAFLVQPPAFEGDRASLNNARECVRAAAELHEAMSS